MRTGIKWLALLAVLAFATTAWAETVFERFDRGKAEFDHKNFGNAIEILKELLYPAVQLTKEADIVRAREILGLSYFYVGEEAKAREEFTQLLYLRPRHRLDPFLVPPPAVAFFDRIWNDPVMKEKLEKIEKERQDKERLRAEKEKAKEKPPKTVVRRIYMQSREEHHSRLLTLLPFGVGQFQNGHTTKGILLASGGGLALVANVTCFGLLSGLRKKTQDERGRTKYYYEDEELADALTITTYVSFGVFMATWLYGVIDASIYFEPVVKTPYVKTKEEREDLGGESTSLLPALFPGGAGLTFSARF
jgi:hypothetical protein